MTKARLLSTVAAAILLAAGAASAQNGKKDEAPAPAPAAQQNAPAEKIAPPMRAGDKKAGAKKAAETTGQAPKELAPGYGQNIEPRTELKGSSDGNGNADVKSKGSKSSKDSKSTTEGAAGASSKSGQAATEKSNATSGQGAAGGSAKLSPEQHTKITAIMRQHKVAPVKLSVSVSLGTRVPDSVHFYALPREVFVIYPEWRGYDYILVGDEILVIDPRTHEIVAILDV